MFRAILIPYFWVRAGHLLGVLLSLSVLSISHGRVQLPPGVQLPAGVNLEQLEQLDILRGLAAGEDLLSEAEALEFPPLLEEEEPEFDPLQALLDEAVLRNAIIRVDPRLQSLDTIIIDFAVMEDPDCVPIITTNRGTVCVSTEEETEEELEIRTRFAGGNPFVLDNAGFLSLPGLRSVALAGLNIDEATARLQAVPEIAQYELSLTLLPLLPVGTAALEPFGYGLFTGRPITFAPATDIPVPAEYVMGPGDNVAVQYFGSVNVEHRLAITRDGILNLPEVGPLPVGGVTFEELKELVNDRILEQLSGVKVSISLGELRSIRIFVLGDANSPGSYTVSALSNMTNALFVSGGITEVGSLRQIALKRNGVTISTMDLYDLLLYGDTRADSRLQPGDVIFIPPIGRTVAVDGMVKRPAIYELVDDETTVVDVIALAGGLMPAADRSAVKVERIIPGRGSLVRDIDLHTEVGAGEMIQDGDVVRVLSNIDQLEDVVRLAGNVQQPGLFEWTPGMRLTDLLAGSELLRPMSDLGYVFIRREPMPNISIEALSASLSEAWTNPGGPEDVLLQPLDTVHVFHLEQGRSHIIGPILKEIVSENRTMPLATINGEVLDPGDYPLEEGMRITDLIRASGGLLESSYLLNLEIVRYETPDNVVRESRILSASLANILDGDLSEDLLLQPYDTVSIRRVPDWGTDLRVELEGEVRFPGTYAIRVGETLSSILQRAGGITDQGFAEGAIFLREDIRRREEEQIALMADRLENSLAVESLTANSVLGQLDPTQAGQALVSALRATEGSGRLVIDVEGILAGDPASDVTLEDGDRLLIPNFSESVMILGEVQYSSTHIFNELLNRDDYLLLSGGLTAGADEERIYVVKANGQVQTQAGGNWFRRSIRFTNSTSGGGIIGPGDTIVVPYETDRISPLTLWQTSTQIIYNVAVTLTAINSVLL